MSIKILGVKIDNLSKEKVLEKIKEFLISSKQHYITTVNPEFLVKAQNNEEFFHILNKADLSLTDGFGVKLASFLFPPIIKNRISGADLTKDILRLAEKESYKVCILNHEKQFSSNEEIRFVLEKKYPNLKFNVFSEVEPRQTRQTDAQILLVALGAPRQEKFIYHNLAKISSVKVAMGVGGSFDFLTGKIKRAPKIMRILGIEWLWRLIQEPKRIKRILTAVVVFSWLVLKDRIKDNFVNH
ncbi:WecB/TagA/CpsF family glycosyltransferase [Candidatus Falkowbacteria bacterium]|jgi:N-acetylglucosaminyldiphosphoundecaprenol N-acetyl-beta-D-mannosaminyltransferase|nr:WecB/TagA/CpsF family glycosyltransferase [Candidatus Falkowbacteria bacterium]MBT4433488.1 WecB/TagA/CpsF family glycosyltransferase [Candidatus Falkowbacteria bacterium]